MVRRVFSQLSAFNYCSRQSEKIVGDFFLDIVVMLLFLRFPGMIVISAKTHGILDSK